MLKEEEVLEVDGLVLRRYRMEDADDIVFHINDERISRYTLNIPHPYGSRDAEEFLSRDRKWQDEGTALNLAITSMSERRVIGGIGLMNIDSKCHHAEIGYWLGTAYWGKGIATVCVKRLVRFGFERLGLQRISAVVFSQNDRSQRVLQRGGFEHEGTMRDRYVLDGHPVDGELYGITGKDMKGP
ncbi:MAG: GNAT family N-acetyltransferase [Candidatus Thermoplasmatota archaeon]|nr:GNAT family N-acetyltransferase [Candidatus Thermoplasmatota archaeon]